MENCHCSVMCIAALVRFSLLLGAMNLCTCTTLRPIAVWSVYTISLQWLNLALGIERLYAQL